VVVNRDAAAGSDGSEVKWASDLALLTGAGLLVVRNEANGRGFQDIVHGGGFSSGEDLAEAEAAVVAGGIKAVVLLGVDPEALPSGGGLAKATFSVSIDLFETGGIQAR